MDLIKVNGKLLELLLLNVLNEHKAYGYELTNRFAPVYQKSSGTIYLALKSLCERELVSRESELSAGRIRVYYTLSSEGRIYLSSLREKGGILQIGQWIYVLCVGTKQGYGVVWNGT